jgi:putative endonuclease
MRQYYVYILASHSRRLYIGVTNDLCRRVAEHREGMDAFTSKYQITRLVHFETSSDVVSAIVREKELKGWLRSRRVELIESANPSWLDLAAGWFDELKEDPSSLRSSG